jgi:hypothetical protein
MKQSQQDRMARSRARGFNLIVSHGWRICEIQTVSLRPARGTAPGFIMRTAKLPFVAHEFDSEKHPSFA